MWTLQVRDKEVKREYDQARLNNWNDLVYPNILFNIPFFVERVINFIFNDQNYFDVITSGYIAIVTILWAVGVWKFKKFCYPEFLYATMSIEVLIIFCQFQFRE